MPAATAPAIHRLSTGTTRSPSGTAREPPGQKSFWTSTTRSASPGRKFGPMAIQEAAGHRRRASGSFAEGNRWSPVPHHRQKILHAVEAHERVSALLLTDRRGGCARVVVTGIEARRVR